MIRYLSVICVPLLALAAAGLAARPDQDRPGPEHEWLAADAGEWAIRAEIRVPGADAPLEVEGRSTMEMLWGRYLREDFVVGEGERAMRGTGLIGYDARAGAFQAVYCLNTGTALSVTTGRRTGGGRVLTFVEAAASAPAVAPGVRGRTVVTRESRDRRVVEYFVRGGDGGPERKQFEMTYTRRE